MVTFNSVKTYQMPPLPLVLRSALVFRIEGWSYLRRVQTLAPSPPCVTSSAHSARPSALPSPIQWGRCVDLVGGLCGFSEMRCLQGEVLNDAQCVFLLLHSFSCSSLPPSPL